MKRIFILLTTAAFLLSACSLLKEKTKIVEYSPYDLHVDNSTFQQAGCFNKPDCLPSDLQRIDPPIDMILSVPDDLGGLDPAYPIAKAYTQSALQLDETKFLYSIHCLGSSYIRYLVIQNKNFHLISSVQDLADFYAPITSPEEAYSYAIAATGLSPIFDLEANPKLIFEEEKIEETNVSETADGYLVHLFRYHMCGCGPHMVNSVDVLVSVNGEITLQNEKASFHDPDLDKVCGD